MRADGARPVPLGAALVLTRKPWQRYRMKNQKSPAPRAAGAFIALGLLAGTLVGVFLHQPSLGLLTGFALGTAIAIALWLIDRRR